MGNAIRKNAVYFDLIDKVFYTPVLESLEALDVYRSIAGNDPLRYHICKTGKTDMAICCFLRTSIIANFCTL